MNSSVVSLLGIAISIAVAMSVALAGSEGGSTSPGGLPLFMLCAMVAFSIQWLMFIPAYIFQTEKYYDLTGSLTYITVTLMAVAFSASVEPGSLLIGSMVIIWAVRLGSFLFVRIMKDGKDVRFTRIKPDFLRFLMTWTLQGLWVFITYSAGLAAMTSGRSFPIDSYVLIGSCLWLVGFAIEVVADWQKSQFRKVEGNKDKFINQGLWKLSRHPNYFGEILLWSGVAVAAYPALSGWQHVTLVSPFFVYLLLTRISGVKLLESRAKRRWGDDADYQAYVQQTPVLVPVPWTRK